MFFSPSVQLCQLCCARVEFHTSYIVLCAFMFHTMRTTSLHIFCSSGETSGVFAHQTHPVRMSLLFPPSGVLCCRTRSWLWLYLWHFQLQQNFQPCPALSWCAAGPATLFSCCSYTTGKIKNCLVTPQRCSGRAVVAKSCTHPAPKTQECAPRQSPK